MRNKNDASDRKLIKNTFTVGRGGAFIPTMLVESEDQEFALPILLRGFLWVWEVLLELQSRW